MNAIWATICKMVVSMDTKIYKTPMWVKLSLALCVVTAVAFVFVWPTLAGQGNDVPPGQNTNMPVVDVTQDTQPEPQARPTLPARPSPPPRPVHPVLHTPTVQPSPTATPQPAQALPTPVPTEHPVSVVHPTPTLQPTATAQPAPTPTVQMISAVHPTATAQPEPTPVPTQQPTMAPTPTMQPTPVPTVHAITAVYKADTDTTSAPLRVTANSNTEGVGLNSETDPEDTFNLNLEEAYQVEIRITRHTVSVMGVIFNNDWEKVAQTETQGNVEYLSTRLEAGQYHIKVKIRSGYSGSTNYKLDN